MIEKTEITICLGSSCFARGNKKTVAAIQTYIEEHNLAEKVNLRGGHCFGNCDKGPTIKINKKFFENIDPANIIDILASEIE
ncbi:MAG: (2Fe-2S) ferredoxin domain-containing protein [Salinivirgaceae bacterium]|jgi:NADH:ubiquinone oxidoreductase subunit E|nr:(2Fe-2S) ferredoxin domain-containing protein [Salinivirgaceae bacterium]